MRSSRTAILGTLAIICIPLIVYGHQCKTALPKAVAVVSATAIEEGRPTHVSFTSAPSIEVSAEVIRPEIRQAIIDARKDMCIAAMIWGEARGEPVAGQYLAGYVGHMRAVDGWFNSHDPCIQVCKHRGKHREFDGTKQFCAQIESYWRGGQHPTAPDEFMKIAHEVRTGAYQPRPECRNVRFFANFAESSPGGIRDFQKHTKIRCVEGDHLFAENRPKVFKAYAKMHPAVAHKTQHKKLAANVK